MGAHHHHVSYRAARLWISGCVCGCSQHGESCYGLVDVKETWADGQATCRALGGHLAEVDSLDEDVFITKMLSDKGVHQAWLGGEDLLNHGTWYWSEVRSLVSDGYMNWADGSPNAKHDENCMKIDATEHGNWYPDECDDKEYFVCELAAQRFEPDNPVV